MIKKFKNVLLSLSAVFAITAPAIVTVPVYATTPVPVEQSVCQGVTTLQVPAKRSIQCNGLLNRRYR